MRAAPRPRSVHGPVRPAACLRLEELEVRNLLDAANIFAHFEGDLITGEAKDALRVHLTADNFTIDGGHAVLGFLVRPGEASGLQPNPVQITTSDNGGVPHILQKILPDGGSLERTGVSPDETVLPTAADLGADRDPVLARAVEMLGGSITPSRRDDCSSSGD